MNLLIENERATLRVVRKQLLKLNIQNRRAHLNVEFDTKRHMLYYQPHNSVGQK